MKNIPEFLKMKPIWSEYKNDEYYKERSSRLKTRFEGFNQIKLSYDNVRNSYFFEKEPQLQY